MEISCENIKIREVKYYSINLSIKAEKFIEKRSVKVNKER